MSSTKIDKVLDIYKLIYRIPSVTSARIIPTVDKGLVVQSFWSQRNLERRTKQKFIQDFIFNANLQPLVAGFPVEVTSELLSASSEDEKLKVILRDVTVEGKSKQFIEVWDSQHLSKSYDLSAYDVHGDVYSEPTFSSFYLSPDNTRLLYVAEKKLPKCEPFYKQKSKSKNDKPSNENKDEEEPSRGTEYVYKPDWGEQLVGKHKSVVVILNIKEDTIVPVSFIPEDYFPAQVIWAPNGEDIVGVAYKLKSRYLGLYACTNRESYIFHLKGTEFHKLTAEELSCRSPRFSPDGKHLIWLERQINSVHNYVQKLMCLKWNSTESPEILIDTINTHVTIADNEKFYGLYNQNLPKRCWSDDSEYIFLSTPQRFNIKSYIVNLKTKVMTEIDNTDDSSLIVLDVKQNYVVLMKTSLVNPSHLVIGKFDASRSNIGNLHLLKCTNLFDIIDSESFIYENTEYVYESNEPVKDFNFTYFGKKNEPNQSMPLIVALHGGPHGSYNNMFYPFYTLLVRLGFGILQINYRGSTGMGGNNVNYLLGKVGNVDVCDCITAIDVALKKYPWIDPKRVNLFGGSHGGFLSAHLSGQYPDKFKAVAMLNPVIDIASMYTTTDIPDWCGIESESSFTYLEKLSLKDDETNYKNLLQKMLKHSPIIHADKVKAPTFIAIGTKDVRVPSFQGRLWYNQLMANNVTTKLFVYEDNHSLVKDEVEIDVNINSILWLMEYNN